MVVFFFLRSSFRLYTSFPLLGFVLSMDRILVQGKPNTNKSVTQYHIKISENGVNYRFIQESGGPQVSVFVNRCGLVVCFCLEQNLFNDRRSSDTFCLPVCFLQYFWGPWFDGDAVESTDLSNPVEARYVKFIPVEPMIQHNNHLCMRVDVQSCQIGT